MTKKATNRSVEEFRSAAASWRTKQSPRLRNKSKNVTVDKGVVTIQQAPAAKPVRELGGPTKVFGRSNISIPEFKTARR